MRITIVGPYWRARWNAAVRRALATLGHTVDTLTYVEPGVISAGASQLPRWIGAGMRTALQAHSPRAYCWAFNQLLVAHTRVLRPDVVLLLKGEIICADTVRRLRRQHGVRVVAWWLDDPFGFPGMLDLSRVCDRFYVFSRHLVRRLHQVGVGGARYLPCAVDPAVYRPMLLTAAARHTLGAPVSFVGAYYPHRASVLSAIADFSPAVWGPEWSDARERGEIPPTVNLRGGDVSPPFMARVLNAARVSLNIHHRQSLNGGLNMRAFEAAACGTFQLVDSVPETDDLFTPGEEIIRYRDIQELRTLLTQYLAAPDEMQAIAQRAYGRVMREHTYQHRLASMLVSMP